MVTIHHYHHIIIEEVPLEDPESLTLLREIREWIEMASQELETLRREVQETKGVTQSAVALIGGLAEQIREHIDDKAALTELANELDANEQALAAAVTAGSPTPPAGGGTGGTGTGGTGDGGTGTGDGGATPPANP